MSTAAKSLQIGRLNSPHFASVAAQAAAGRLVAVQLATAIATLVLVLMCFAFDQPAFADLPLALALLAPPGTLVMTLFLERWL